MGISSATGMPRTVEIKGKSYQMRRQTIEDIGKLVEFHKQNQIKAIRPILDILSSAERKEYINEIINKKYELDDIGNILEDPANAGFIMRLGLDCNANITEAEINEILSLEHIANEYRASLPEDAQPNPPEAKVEGSP